MGSELETELCWRRCQISGFHKQLLRGWLLNNPCSNCRPTLIMESNGGYSQSLIFLFLFFFNLISKIRIIVGAYTCAGHCSLFTGYAVIITSHPARSPTFWITREGSIHQIGNWAPDINLNNNNNFLIFKKLLEFII